MYGEVYGQIYEVEFDVRVRGLGSRDDTHKVVVPVYAKDPETAISILAEALKKIVDDNERAPDSQEGF